MQGVAKEYSKYIIFNIPVKETEHQHEENVSESKDIINLLTQFKCFKFKEIVLFTNKFNSDLQEE